MPDGFEKLTVKAEQLQTGRTSSASESDGSASTEEIALGYLRAAIEIDARPIFKMINQPVEGARAPAHSFRSKGVRTEELTNSQVASFEQVIDTIPVFGSHAEVVMGMENEFQSTSLSVVDVGRVKLKPEFNSTEAKAKLTGLLKGGKPVSRRNDIEDPVLSLLPNPQEKGKLRLVWHFSGVEFELATEEAREDKTPAGNEGVATGGCTAECRFLENTFDYFLDAQSGEIVFLFPNSAHVDVPTQCSGEDEDGVNQSFYGRVAGTEFEMNNPFEDVQTRDLELNLYNSTPWPVYPVRNPSNDWQATNRAAVTAHVNATRVIDFLFRILRRNSVDDQGMTLLSVVNCTKSPTNNEWDNAMWWRNRMWYGQSRDNNGNLRSWARYLDIVAHEVFHGVTERTANIIYAGQSGALNESFSDIFGIIIRNWYTANNPNDVATWNWEIGSGVGAGGGPLRRVSNPSSVGRWRTLNDAAGNPVLVDGYPDHMDDFVTLPISEAFDYGGVHWFSNIHNFAFYKLLVAERNDKTRVFEPAEIAILYYLVLTKLGRLSVFSDAKEKMLDVAETLYAGNSSRITEAKDTIETAYDEVGI